MTKLIDRYSVSAGKRQKHEKTTETHLPQYMDGGALDCLRHSFSWEGFYYTIRRRRVIMLNMIYGYLRYEKAIPECLFCLCACEFWTICLLLSSHPNCWQHRHRPRHLLYLLPILTNLLPFCMCITHTPPHFILPPQSTPPQCPVHTLHLFSAKSRPTTTQ